MPTVRRLAYCSVAALLFAVGPAACANEAAASQRFRLITMAVVREAPEGRIRDIWNAGDEFVSDQITKEWVRIDRRAADPQAPEAARAPLWISRYYVEPVALPPPPPAMRYILVDKSDFELRVIETAGPDERVLYRTPVAVGRDGCLPKERGGNCYYTDAGEYKVRWKVHDPRGIEWCVPKFMEKEYEREIARGRRCFRGVIGTHALNIGKSYAIHGTHNPASIGTKSTHGCIRAANQAMTTIYDLVDVGARVIIRE